MKEIYLAKLDEVDGLRDEGMNGTAIYQSESIRAVIMKDKNLSRTERKELTGQFLEKEVLCYDAERQFGKAEESLENAIGHLGENSERLQKLFRYQSMGIGKYQEKPRASLTANKKSPSLTDKISSVLGLEKVQRKKKQNKALQTLQKAIKLAEDDQTRVNCYETMVDYVAAVPDLVMEYGFKALDLDPKNHSAKSALSHAFQNKGFSDDSREFLFSSTRDLLEKCDRNDGTLKVVH